MCGHGEKVLLFDEEFLLMLASSTVNTLYYFLGSGTRTFQEDAYFDFDDTVCVSMI